MEGGSIEYFVCDYVQNVAQNKGEDYTWSVNV